MVRLHRRAARLGARAVHGLRHGRRGGAHDFLGSLAYFLVATMARVADLFDRVSVPWAAAQVTSWAGNRLLDTVVGCAIALAATYLLWPRDRETPEAVPVGG